MAESAAAYGSPQRKDTDMNEDMIREIVKKDLASVGEAPRTGREADVP